MEIMAPGFYDCVKDSINNQFHIRNALKERGKQHFWIIINLESVAWMDEWMWITNYFFSFHIRAWGRCLILTTDWLNEDNCICRGSLPGAATSTTTTSTASGLTSRSWKLVSRDNSVSNFRCAGPSIAVIKHQTIFIALQNFNLTSCLCIDSVG